MNAVGIDVSKGKSTVTIRRPGDIVLMPPCDNPHTQSAINDLIEQIRGLDGETKVCMEHTDRYYKPVTLRRYLIRFRTATSFPILFQGKPLPLISSDWISPDNTGMFPPCGASLPRFLLLL